MQCIGLKKSKVMEIQAANETDWISKSKNLERQSANQADWNLKYPKLGKNTFQ
jgi:hypothetical protein